MKGIIFSKFAEFVENKYGLFTWQFLIDETKPVSEGVYVATKKYDDQELLNYIQALSRESGDTGDDIERGFGIWVFPALYELAPAHTREILSFHEYISKVDDVIHVEVRKLFQGAETPNVVAGESQNEKFSIYYASPRKLCRFCEGLILGCAEKFGLEVSLSQSSCMRQGDDVCCIEVLK